MFRTWHFPPVLNPGTMQSYVTHPPPHTHHPFKVLMKTNKNARDNSPEYREENGWHHLQKGDLWDLEP